MVPPLVNGISKKGEVSETADLICERSAPDCAKRETKCWPIFEPMPRESPRRQPAPQATVPPRQPSNPKLPAAQSPHGLSSASPRPCTLVARRIARSGRHPNRACHVSVPARSKCIDHPSNKKNSVPNTSGQSAQCSAASHGVPRRSFAVCFLVLQNPKLNTSSHHDAPFPRRLHMSIESARHLMTILLPRLFERSVILRPGHFSGSIRARLPEFLRCSDSAG